MDTEAQNEAKRNIGHEWQRYRNGTRSGRSGSFKRLVLRNDTMMTQDSPENIQVSSDSHSSMNRRHFDRMKRHLFTRYEHRGLRDAFERRRNRKGEESWSF